MPKRTARRPKIPAQASKLRPEQLLQVAAIEEIEAILNADIGTAGLTEVVTGVPERPAKKRPRLTVGAAAASPYVVDLKQAAASNVSAQPAARTPWRLRRQERRLAAQAPVPLAPLAPQLSAKAAAAGERLAAYARPWRRVEPYTHELAVLWLVRLAFTLATLPFRVAFYLLQSVWEVAGGFERLAAAEIALRVSLRGFFIAGSVVTHALGSAGHEVATEVADMVRRSAWSIGRRLRTLFRRSARRGVRAGKRH